MSEPRGIVCPMCFTNEPARQAAEWQRFKNLLGNATGAIVDAGLPGDMTPADAIYELTRQRDVLQEQLDRINETENR